ncbi:hypothetical protein OS493_037499 [Desmophyllum pertusum]|uniref:Uncharacterized protein n=1 Tax=Desmophyllum pertusum TaxID=174260 RepID=A0A9W9YUB0_9CNID|nr:hypothetical protein OS493_037499 [Desmophyllum pertusum]
MNKLRQEMETEKNKLQKERDQMEARMANERDNRQRQREALDKEEEELQAQKRELEETRQELEEERRRLVQQREPASRQRLSAGEDETLARLQLDEIKAAISNSEQDLNQTQQDEELQDLLIQRDKLQEETITNGEHEDTLVNDSGLEKPAVSTPKVRDVRKRAKKEKADLGPSEDEALQVEDLEPPGVAATKVDVSSDESSSEDVQGTFLILKSKPSCVTGLEYND